MKIHKEGLCIIAYTFVILIVINVAIYYLSGRNLLFWSVLIISAGLMALILNFFRSPCRIFSGETDGVVVAPADGKVVVIEDVFENEYFNDKRKQVSIFMSPFDVHINWVPVNGKVLESFHQNGRFKAAYLPKSSTENERSTIVIETHSGQTVLVRQIAGAMAKRIVTYAAENTDCHINEQLGFIKFGSRVDLFLPVNTEVKVNIDDIVKGNQTIVALLKQTAV